MRGRTAIRLPCWWSRRSSAWPPGGIGVIGRSQSLAKGSVKRRQRGRRNIALVLGGRVTVTWRLENQTRTPARPDVGDEQATPGPLYRCIPDVRCGTHVTSAMGKWAVSPTRTVTVSERDAKPVAALIPKQAAAVAAQAQIVRSIGHSFGRGRSQSTPPHGAVRGLKPRAERPALTRTPHSTLRLRRDLRSTRRSRRSFSSCRLVCDSARRCRAPPSRPIRWRRRRRIKLPPNRFLKLVRRRKLHRPQFSLVIVRDF
jgi:hypothetical protein